MPPRPASLESAALCAGVLATSLGLLGPWIADAAPPFKAVANVVPFASGLQFPRGLKFGPDGNLYVSNWGFRPPGMAGPRGSPR